MPPLKSQTKPNPKPSPPLQTLKRQPYLILLLTLRKVLNFQHIVSDHTLLRLNLLQVQNFCEGIFFADDFTLDLQDAVLKIIYNWLRQNNQPEYPTPLLHGCLFLHAYYNIFSQLFIDATINLFYTKRNSFRKHTVALLLLFCNINKSMYNLNTKGFNQSTQNKS